MLSISRFTALFLSFALGFSLGIGALGGFAAIALGTFTVRDLERNGIPIPDESFIGENPEVDILDLTAIQFIDEFKELQKVGDDLTIDYIQNRYALIFPEKINALLPAEAREISLQKLFSMDGVHMVLSSVFIGNIEKYTCLNADGTEGGDPKDETSYWVNAQGKKLSGIEEIIADFTLDDFLSGNINTDVLLHGELVLADVLGYTFDEEKNAWFDSGNNKVTGVMAVFADCTIDDVSTRINTVEIGKLIGYEKGEDGKWYDTADNGELTPISGFMSKVANGTIKEIDKVFNTLAVGDIVEEKNRTGIFKLISPETEIAKISTEVEKSIKASPLQFFINENLVTFTDSQMESLDDLNKNKIIDAENYNSYYYKEGIYEVTPNSDGTYTIPEWRTAPLNEAFSYILGQFVQ